jgi:creatinine amidohydrolase
MTREIIYSVRGPRLLPEMTSEEVGEELKHTDIIIFPVASTEVHGSHLPLAADTIQGTEAVRRIVARFASQGIRVVGGLPIPLGVSMREMDFPGTISLMPDTMMAVIRDVCNSVIKHGFRKIVLVMSHDGNLGTLYSAAEEISKQPGVRVLLINWLPFLRSKYTEVLKSKSGGHAGEGETARVLAAIPELVHLDRAKVGPEEGGKGPHLECDMSIHFGGGTFDPARGLRDLTPIGSFGDPRGATAETGDKCYGIIEDWACEVIKRHFGLKGETI